MIADWETNALFLSDQLEKKQPEVFHAIQNALMGSIPIKIIPGTADIWCRDYMPIQIDELSFCQFVYQPDYLRRYQHLVTSPEKCRLPFMANYRQEQIVLDGGNVVSSRTKTILTDKFFKENPDIPKSKLIARLTELFQAECIFIPTDPYDPIGHADGVVRFVSETQVLINDYSAVDPQYGRRVQKVLESAGLDVETLPMFEDDGDNQSDDELPTAIGIYINFLRVGNTVVIPAFDRPDDELALNKLRAELPHARVFSVPCRKLAEESGVLNCISWTIRDVLASPSSSES